VFKNYLTSSMEFLSTSLNDPSQRVRYQAIEVVGRLAVLYPASAAAIVQRFVPPLTSLMQDSSMCDKVHALSQHTHTNILPIPYYLYTYILLIPYRYHTDITLIRILWQVRGHAASALINIVNPDSCEGSFLEPYLEGMLRALCANLQSASLEVQGPCLLLLGLIAQVPSHTNPILIPY